jgi:hypothetical protein
LLFVVVSVNQPEAGQRQQLAAGVCQQPLAALVVHATVEHAAKQGRPRRFGFIAVILDKAQHTVLYHIECGFPVPQGAEGDVIGLALYPAEKVVQ